MNEQADKRCFVLLPSGNPHYMRLFDELFAMAIVEAGLLPCCLQQSDARPLPLAMLLQEITLADAVFADLSRNDIDVWLALGCALALNKPLCLVSSRLEFSLSLDIHDLEIIPYPANPFPSEYDDLRQNITAHLLAKLPQKQAPETYAPEPYAAETRAPETSSPDPILPAEQPDPVSLSAAAENSPFTPAVAFLSELSEDLTSYEVLAMTIIDAADPKDGLSPRALGLEMKSNDSANLTSHAMNSLRRRKFIDRRPVRIFSDNETFTSDNLFITPLGADWLIRNGRRKDPARAESSTDSLLFLATREL